MSFSYLPFYTGDYLRDTRGLSMAGHGCYVLFLCYCWDTREPLPLDPEELATICGARSQEERITMDRILKRYFVAMADGHYNQRLQREIERSEAISRERSAAGRKGFLAKARQLPSKSRASASNPTPITIPITIEGQKQVPARKRATLINPDFGISERVRTWATDKGHTRLDERLEDFIGKARAKAYTYVDWDDAFMNAIRADWANLNGKGKTHDRASEREQTLHNLTGGIATKRGPKTIDPSD